LRENSGASESTAGPPGCGTAGRGRGLGAVPGNQARRGIRFRAQLAVKDENFVKDQFDDYINSMRMRAGVRAADT
jgi:hypothetical protein